MENPPLLMLFDVYFEAVGPVVSICFRRLIAGVEKLLNPAQVTPACNVGLLT